MKTLKEIMNHYNNVNPSTNKAENFIYLESQVENIAKEYAREALKEASEEAKVKPIENKAGNILLWVVNKDSIINIELK